MKPLVIFELMLCLVWHLYPEVSLQRKCYSNCTFQRGTMNSLPDFEELTKCTTFVDKTFLISEFFTNSGFRQFNLITFPHKFGKTTNLSMMKKFLEGNVDLETNKMVKSFNSDTYDMFVDSKLNLKISALVQNVTEFHKNHFQAYAMIYVSFKTITANTYDKLMIELRKNFQMCFKEYEWLYKFLTESNSENNAELKKQLKLMKKIIDGNMEKEDIADSLFTLANILSTNTPFKNVFLLIDDYDDPIIKAIEHKFDLKRCSKLIDEVFSSLFISHQRPIRYALITGTINVLERAKFSHIKHWNFLDHHHFAKYFGFTEDELDDLLANHGIQRSDRAAIKRHYNGYKVCSSTKRIYNPYSIAHYLCSRNPENVHLMMENYWAQVTNIPNFLKCFKRNKSYKGLLSKMLSLKNITFPLIKYFDSAALEKLQDITHDETYELTDVRADVVLSFLFHNGYLSYAESPKMYRLPNEEIIACLNHTCMEADESYAIEEDELLKRLSPQAENQAINTNL